MFKLPKIFTRKPDLTTMEEFGTPWSVFPANGAAPRHPEDDSEALRYLLDTLWPTLDAPVTLVYEHPGADTVLTWHAALTVTTYADALPFIYEHAAH